MLVDDGSEVGIVFILVTLVKNINHTLSVCISGVRAVRWAAKNHSLIDRVSSFIWENARDRHETSLTTLKFCNTP